MITPYLMFSGILLTLAVAIMGTTATAQGKNPIVVIETSLGSITAELYADKTPISVRNFLSYIESDFYSGTIFHRVIKGFMIQGGGMTADMTRKPTEAPIKNEATNGLSNERGTLAMARTAEVDSASSQFFINTVNNGGRGLDHRGTTPAAFGYAVFGRVTAGMDVVDMIEGVQTAAGDVPVTPVVIKAVRLQQ